MQACVQACLCACVHVCECRPAPMSIVFFIHISGRDIHRFGHCATHFCTHIRTHVRTHFCAHVFAHVCAIGIQVYKPVVHKFDAHVCTHVYTHVCHMSTHMSVCRYTSLWSAHYNFDTAFGFLLMFTMGMLCPLQARMVYTHVFTHA